MASPIRRNEVVKFLGTPDATEGSVNEPREREENGFRFNERWLYKRPRNDPARAYERVVYWHRYDFVGTAIRRSPDSPWEVDASLAEALRRAA
ncbi:MAG: hypothetical protein KatS3mg077_2653 [Candidatus Binatia bacterium]|nr:MAG: hypothetical protein KatS3mg077_2653 [Candidatus Binatia bacterium]